MVYIKPDVAANFSRGLVRRVGPVFRHLTFLAYESLMVISSLKKIALFKEIM